MSLKAQQKKVFVSSNQALGEKKELLIDNNNMTLKQFLKRGGTIVGMKKQPKKCFKSSGAEVTSVDVLRDGNNIAI